METDRFFQSEMSPTQDDIIETTEGSALQTIELQHQHHWLIEEAKGPTSNGCCKGCGEEKTFKNWLSDVDFVSNEDHRVLRQTEYY